MVVRPARRRAECCHPQRAGYSRPWPLTHGQNSSGGIGMSVLDEVPGGIGLPDDPPAAVTVVVCAYTERRWEQTRAAVASVLAQEPPPRQVVLVVDHNARLAERCRREISHVKVVESVGPCGLSGARNSGLRAASGPVTVFLDDDATARPGWLAALIEPYRSDQVVATGGMVHPQWPAARPAWLPPTFDWVVGCSYQGLPEVPAAVRNPIGANMSFRTELALDAGGFDSTIGRVGVRPRGCEETEMAIRITAARPGSVVFYVPAAAVDHSVSAERLTVRYFLRRCWHEGRSKAYVVRLAGAAAGLSAERRQAASVIPATLLRDLRAGITGDGLAFARVAAAAAGLAATAAGYLAGRALTHRRASGQR